MKKISLISIFLLLLIIVIAGCAPKKPDSTDAFLSITEEASAEQTTSIENTEDTEEDVTPEYVDVYTVELKEDEVIEIH